MHGWIGRREAEGRRIAAGVAQAQATAFGQDASNAAVTWVWCAETIQGRGVHSAWAKKAQRRTVVDNAGHGVAGADDLAHRITEQVQQVRRAAFTTPLHAKLRDCAKPLCCA